MRGWALLAALVAGCSDAPAETPAQATPGPAMWVIRDHDSTIYLLGTVHAVRAGSGWRTPAIDRALRDATTLYLEIAEDADDTSAMAALLGRYGVDPTRPLSTWLTPEQERRLTAAATSLRVPRDSLEPMRPWLAGLTLTAAQLGRDGYDPAMGADRVLEARARAEGDRVLALETAEQQIRLLAEGSAATQVETLMEAVDQAEAGPALMAELSSAWERGDEATLARLVATEVKDRSPEVYQALLVRRNAAWTRQIEAMVAGSGTTMIAVGAGHLVGPDGVPTMLAQRGIRAERQ